MTVMEKTVVALEVTEALGRATRRSSLRKSDIDNGEQEDVDDHKKNQADSAKTLFDSTLDDDDSEDQDEKESPEPGETPNEEDDPEEPPEEVDYEAQRRQNILRNQQLMLQLGLNPISLHSSSRPPFTSHSSSSQKSKGHDDDDEWVNGIPSAKRRMRKSKPHYTTSTLIPTRLSKRIRGLSAEELGNVDLDALENKMRLDLDGRRMAAGAQGEVSPSSTVPPSQLGAYSKKQKWLGRKQTTGYEVELELPCCGVPITLGSIATTIWDIGVIYKGKDHRMKYWSGKGSMFRHPYPIGYKAEKHVFRERYTMEIQEGPEGPLFIVESLSGKRYEGTSPTLPWTKVCLDSYSKGTRISGPLFFGFSDPITQKLIGDLEGYQEWEVVAAEVEEERIRHLAELAAQEEETVEAGNSEDESS
ncbi:hypothetical protein EDD11_010342 [Mortierella claussenii]|nr:hypothetical protein EDD11_010342 [Mortierella claussenii]